MRIRTAFIGALLAVVVSLGLATPAGAAESIGSCVLEVGIEGAERIEAGEPESEVLDDLESAAERCIEAPNPILPELNELIWVTLAFGILAVLGLKFAYPAVAGAMDARTERIRSDLEAAEQAKLTAEAEAEEYRASLADSQGEATRIVDEARAAAEALRAERAATAEAEAAEIRSRALTEAEAIKAQALADLRSEVASLAVGAAEQVVQRNLDADAQAELIENYINQVGSGR